MTATKSLIALIGALIVTAGCAPNLDKLRETAATGDEFSRVLTREYLKFANVEADLMDDWLDADHFAAKGLRAAGGEAVPPERIADWRVPAEHTFKLARARALLSQALDAGARKSDPEQAGIAQVRFDCWVEQREENFQTDDIARCRNGLFAALDAMEANADDRALTGAMDKKGRITVFFGHDRWAMGSAAQSAIRGAARKLGGTGTPHFLHVTGHADRSGPTPYNKSLSLKRAAAVRAALIRAGFPGHRIRVNGRGEEAPMIVTPDGMREPGNRRAVIAPAGAQTARAIAATGPVRR